MAAKLGLKEVMLVTSFVGSIVLGVVWVENRYQQVTSAVCLSEKNVLSREISGNEIKLEFYNNEMMAVGTKESRVNYLNLLTLSLEERQRVLKLDRGKLVCG